MLALQYIRENKNSVLKGLEKRGFKSVELIDQIIDLDQQRRSIQTKLDSHLSYSNKMAKEIGYLFKSGETEKANTLKEKSTAAKELTKQLQEQLQKVSSELLELRTQIPNIPDESVPAGNTEEDNEEVFKAGEIPELDANALPHWDLASKYDLIDFELGNKITGAGFPVYKGKGARLQRGLINYFLDRNTAAGYKEVNTPEVLDRQLWEKSGHWEKYGENMYTSQTPDEKVFAIKPMNCPGHIQVFNQGLKVIEIYL